MKKRVVLDLDDVEADRLDLYSSINKTAPEPAAKQLIQQKIQDWIDSLDDDEYDETKRNSVRIQRDC